MVFTSALISFAWGYLLFGGSIAAIWPLFGLSNQLLASMTLAIGTTVLLRMGKVKYIWITVLPLCFMIVTAMTAGFYNIFEFYLPKQQWLLAGSSVIMMVLIVFVLINAVRTWLGILKAEKKRVQQVL